MASGGEMKRRKEFLLKLLKSSGDEYVKGAYLREQLSKHLHQNIGKTTLTDTFSDMRAEGYSIESSPRGFRLAQTGEAPEPDDEDEDIDDYTPSDDDTVTRWLIMLIFAKERNRYLSFSDLYEEYCELTKAISETALRGHLGELCKMRYITEISLKELKASGHLPGNTGAQPSNKRFFRLTETAPVPAFIDEDELSVFNEYFYEKGYDTELGEVLKKINDKASEVIPDIYTEGSVAYRASGRKTDIAPEMTGKLNEFLSLPFAECAVNVKYEEKTTLREYVFKTALVMFNVETGSFYLLGEVKEKRNWRRKNFRLELIREMNVSEESKKIKNDIFESTRYMSIFRQMWSVAPDEPAFTEVHFENLPYIARQVREIAQARKDTARVRFSKEEGEWIVYEDEIIGLHDFLRFVRSLGSSAVVVSPEGSRQHIIEKTKQTIENYRELHEKWKSTQTPI